MNRKRLGYCLILLTVVCLLLAGLATSAQASPKSQRIDLPLRSFTPEPNQLSFFDQRDINEPQTILIQFSQNPADPTKRALNRAGVHLQQYIGGGAWTAWMDADVNRRALESADVRWAGPMLPEDRVAPRVTGQEVPQWAVAGDDILISVQFVKQFDESAGEAVLRGLGAEVGDYISALNVWYAKISPSFVERLSAVQGVLAVDYIAPPITEVNAGVRAALRVDEVYVPPLQLRGAGVTVCVYDAGIVYAHPDFENRLTVGEPGATHYHSTHVAGTVAGNGADPYRGMAPEANLVSYMYEACIPNCLYDSPQDIFENYQEAWLLHDARIFTNSIGSNTAANGYPCSWEGDYELVSALLDSIVRGGVGAPLIVAFAAGNERGYGTCGTTYNTMGVPAGAKNIITVGASDDNDNMSDFSSWGPPDDGRVKPEVTAPGVDVVSCNSGGGYTTLSGTSMATPAISGVNALLVEAWGRYAITDFPMPATIKAILCNSAEDLFNHGPDYQYGYGRGDVVRAVDIIQTFGYLEASVGDNGLFTYDFNVPAALGTLKLTIAWSDPPASYLAPSTLINDLDLTLVDPQGGIHYPFILNPANPSAPATAGVNTRDVVEQVEVMNAMEGTWTMRVSGTDVPVGPQDFSAAANVPLASGIMTVTGTVYNQSNQPIAGARLTLSDSGRGTTADQNGDYFMYLPISETTPLTAEADGYYWERGYIIPNENDEAVIDFHLYNRPVGQVNGVVRDINQNPQSGVTVTVVELPAVTTTTDAQGQFAMTLPVGDVYTLSSASGNLSGTSQVFTKQNQAVTVAIYLLDTQQQVTGPSDQKAYIAVQNGDGHVYAPTFNWRAVDPLEGGPGTRINTPAEETAVLLDLPFTVGYFGTDYDQITVCENGFFCFGDVTGDPSPADYSNSLIPGADGPPAMVAPFWEDFYALSTNLSYYHDAAHGLFIVEWYNSRQYLPDTAYESFEVVFNDRDFPTPPPYLPYDVDTRILFQYAMVTDLGNATVGIESPDEQAGLGLLYFDNSGDGSYDPTVSTITAGSAILFYVPKAKVQGHVGLDIPDPEVDITVSSPYGDFVVGPNGNYSINVPPGSVEVLYSAAGYELLDRRYKLSQYQQLNATNVILSKLLRPQNVTYQDNGNSITVNWTVPGPGALDNFTGYYRIYRDGLVQSLLQQTTWTDNSPAGDPLYWVTAIYTGGESDSSMHAVPGVLAGVDENNLLPKEFEIGQAYPNPFNPTTSVSIALPKPAAVRAVVVDILGREVVRLANGEILPAGYHRLTWDGEEHASGMYFLQVDAGPKSGIRKLVLLK